MRPIARLFAVILLTPFLAYALPTQALVLDTSALTGAGEPGTDYIPSLSFALDPPLTPYTANVSLKPGMPQKIDSFSATAQATYIADRPTQFADWTFATADESDLTGTLVVDTYQARRGTANSEGTGNAAGALFRAHYDAASTDPLNLTWLQMFRDNTGANGSIVAHIDPFPNDDGNEDLPFYWRDNESGENLTDPFSDRPHDVIPSVPFFRTVDFQLYLVGYDPADVNDGTQGGSITVYGGVNWGYVITAAEPGAMMQFVSALAVFVLMVGLRNRGRQNSRAV